MIHDLVNWERLFDQKSTDAQVATFNDTVLNTFRNSVPNRYITIDDKDSVWMNETIKSKMKGKNILYKKCIQNGRFESDFIFLENLITELNEFISSAKASYYENLGKKLNNPLVQAKTYCTILKTFYNDKKIPLIPPLLMLNNNCITDIKTKANIFNKFFAEQYTPLKNGSVLPINQMFLTQSRLGTLDFTENKILKIIMVLNIHIAHGHDDISIRMIQICDRTLLRPIIIIFQNSVKYSYYPDIWKRSNIISVHKKVINN